MPLLRGRALAGEATYFFEHQGNRAIRSGDRKAVAMADEPWELYDLSRNRTEVPDGRGEIPSGNAGRSGSDEPYQTLLDSLTERWERWARETDVVPRP